MAWASLHTGQPDAEQGEETPAGFGQIGPCSINMG